MVAATKLNQQVHQRLTERGTKEREGGKREKVKKRGREGGGEGGSLEERNTGWGEREKERETRENIGLQSLTSFSCGKVNSNYFIQTKQTHT